MTTNKTCDTLAIDVLSKMSACLVMCTSSTVHKPKGYENFVLLTRVNSNYNSVTIADENMQIIMQREWADEDQLSVQIKCGSQQFGILDFMKDVGNEQVISDNLLAIEAQIDDIKTACAELYDLIKSKPF